MKLTIVAFAACAALTLLAPQRLLAGDRSGNCVINDLDWSTYPSESKPEALMPADDNCCNCAPTDSDQQCFLECNAMLPRCRPAAPRSARPSSNASNPNPNGPITGFCCYGNVRKFMSPMLPLGAQCRMSVYNWGLRETYWVTGRACY